MEAAVLPAAAAKLAASAPEAVPAKIPVFFCDQMPNSW